jgi:radical SAM superfamily enzyme YgiQ (UPF0313 family)
MLVRPKPHKNSLGLTNLMTCEPLELEYVSALVKSKGHEVVFVDKMLERKSITHFLKKYNPDIICFTAYITHVNVIKSYSDEVKKYNRKIVTVVGGVHSEVIPKDFTHGSIDYILGINGLQNLEILLDALKNGEKEILFNNDKLIQYALNMMPDRNLTKKYRHKYDYAYHAPCALLKTSFGCPYSCTFCFCIEITRHCYYERDLEIAISELKEITEPNVFIVDDNFLVSKERIAKFCELLKKNNIKKKFIVFGRADFIVNNEDSIKLLSEHGLDAVFVGIESFKQADLDNFNKRTNADVSEKASEILYRYGVDLYAGAIVGPDWDRNDFKEFIKWLKRMHIRFTNLQPLVPLPGTSLYEEYKNQLLLKREEYEKWDLTHIAIIPTKISPSRYYWEIIKGYFKTSSSFSSVMYIYKKCGFKIAYKCVSGAIVMLWHYFKMMFEYRGLKPHE